MTLTIKHEYSSIYPAEIRGVPLVYINSTVHPVTNTWYFLVKAPSGDFHSVERRHVTEYTKLKAALE